MGARKQIGTQLIFRRGLMQLATSVACCGIACSEDVEAPRRKGVTLDTADTEAGLEEIVKRALDAANTSDSSTLNAICEGWVFGEAAKHFTDMFGEELAPRLVDELRDGALYRGAEMREYLRLVVRSGKTLATAHRVETPDDPEGTAYQSMAVAAMKNKRALYYARITHPTDEKQSTALWSFVHDGRRFRYAGKLKKVLREPLSEQADVMAELRIADARAFQNQPY